MKLITILVMMSVNLFQNINSKTYRVMFDDKLLPYTDKSIPFITDYFATENFYLEQIDDDSVEIGGYLLAKKSMDRNLPLHVIIRTQAFERASWNEGQFRMTLPSVCHEFTNPMRFWYNTTKLFTTDLCPAKIGDKWKIETHAISLVINLPPTIPIVPWRGFALVTQGFPGFEKLKFGFGMQLNFVPLQ